MATVLESLSIPRPSAIAPYVFAPVPTSSPSAISGRRSSVASPDLRGLKIQNVSAAAPRLASPFGLSSRLARRGGRGIVCEAQNTAVGVPAVMDSNWQSDVLESDLPVLVEFWAPWCGPCRMIHPVIDELSKLYAGKLRCYKVNTDESASIATKYGIRSIPTIMIFKGGEKKDAVIGAVPKSTLITSIEKFL